MSQSFDWVVPAFEQISEETYDVCQKILKWKMIHSVERVDDTIKITHTVQCGNLFWASTGNEKEQVMTIPYTTGLCVCESKKQCQCFSDGCAIILAAYYYNKRKFFHEVICNEIAVDSLTDKKIANKILSSRHQKNGKQLLIQAAIGCEQYQEIIKSFPKYPRPNLAFSILEQSDGIKGIYLRQQELLDDYLQILHHYKMVTNTNYRTIDMSHFSEKDFPTDEDQIVVITHLYAWDFVVEDEIQYLKLSLERYIQDNQQNTVFIFLDKPVNYRKFIQNHPMIQLLFQTCQLEEMTLDELQDAFFSLCGDSIVLTARLKKHFRSYLEEQYPYSPYKNLEFISFIFEKTLQQAANNGHPFELQLEDCYIFNTNQIEEWSELNKLVGLQHIKNEIANLQAYLTFKKEKDLLGNQMPELDLHMVYYGNPGTGKTTVARLFAGILFKLRYIRYNKCIEVESKDLIAGGDKQTAEKTNQVIQKAMGGVLFIDEAYAIMESKQGKECVATLIKAMEDYRDDLVVIMAGYKTEMLKFLSMNSGFSSRIAYYFDFPNYQIEELMLMTEQLFEKYGVTTEGCLVMDKIQTIYQNAMRVPDTFGNSRFVRNTVDKILKQHAINTVHERNSERKNHLITVDDIKSDIF